MNLLGSRIHPDRVEVVKMLPSAPPRRGEKVLVDGKLHLVTWCRVRWRGRVWTIRSLRAKPVRARADRERDAG